jgi:hypothetical protein
MRSGKALKTVAIAFATVFAIATELTLVFGTRMQKELREHVARNLMNAALAAGISLEYGDISANPITGIALHNLCISTSSAEGLKSRTTVKKVSLLYSLHLFPSFHVRIDGLQLLQPRVQIDINADGPAHLRAALTANILEGGGLSRKKIEMISQSAGDGDERVDIARELSIIWKDGSADITRIRDGQPSEPRALLLRNISGRLAYDRGEGDLSFKINAAPNDAAGSIDFMAKRKADIIDVALKTKQLEGLAFARFLPRLIVVSKETSTDLDLTAQSNDHGTTWNADLKLGIDHLSLNHWRISDRPIKDIDLRLTGKLLVDAMDRRIRFKGVRFGTKSFLLNASGQAALMDGFQLELRMESGRISIQRMLDAIPKGFAPLIRDAQVKGSIDIGLDFAIDTNHLSSLAFAPEIEVKGFELLRAPQAVDIERLKQPFLHQAMKKGQVVKEFVVGPQNYWFVPFRRLGTHTIKGVLTCEDGSFFSHSGFRVEHFRESIIQDIRERRFARGASTITMQTAKNLFLTGKKNLSRKFQEILIAYAMEQMLTKERIFEIYMNIIEWGPNIYGIGAASKHYFDIWPKDLGPLEAAFLGSIIPTASRSHYMYRQGHVPDSWSTYLALIVSKMGIAGEAYAALEPFQPEFGWVRKKRLATGQEQTSKSKAGQRQKSAVSKTAPESAGPAPSGNRDGAT